MLKNVRTLRRVMAGKWEVAVMCACLAALIVLAAMVLFVSHHTVQSQTFCSLLDALTVSPSPGVTLTARQDKILEELTVLKGDLQC